MVARIDALYNTIFGRLLLNELSAVLSLRYLLMTFEIDKGITSIRNNQIKARRGYILVVRATMKQLKVMIVKTLKEWDK